MLDDNVTITVLNLGTIENTSMGRMLVCTLLSVAETEQELAYYVGGNALKPIQGEYLFSELMDPVFTADGEKLKVKVAVTFLTGRSFHNSTSM